MELTTLQAQAATANGSLFLEGHAGTGKTRAALAHIEQLLDSGVAPGELLIMVPQRTLALPYDDLLADTQLVRGTQVGIMTLGGLAQQAVDLFWPMVEHGFAHPDRRPTFLSLETAQYHMARVVGPLIDREGYFDTVTIDNNRLYSQLIDNLNKAAVVGFPYAEIGPRLKSAWGGADIAQQKIYDDVQACVDQFRGYCLEHNLLDFSLQVEIFAQQLWNLPQYQAFFKYKHLIVDNIEEDTPVAHTLVASLLDRLDSALIIYDLEAGYRRFLGADPDNAYKLRNLCDQQMTLTDSFVTTPEIRAFGQALAHSLRRSDDKLDVDPRAALRFDNYKYNPEMIDGVAENIAALVHHDGVQPENIVVLAPYLSDALRFSLMNRLEALEVPVRSHRPSRALREEPATVCLLTLAQLAHPHWNLPPTPFDVIYALMEAIDDLDLVRAQLLTFEAFRDGELQPFERLRTNIQERVTFVLGERYERVRGWLVDYIATTSQDENGPLVLDHFFSRLFGEMLSQPGFGFHDDFDAAEATANLIDSARKFRRVIGESEVPLAGDDLSREYVQMVGQGIIADQYLGSWEVQQEEAVLLAPAYTFLMTNRPVDYQFWLNVGGRGWSERLYQPLTNPYVLSRQWQAGRIWTDTDEVEVSREALYRLVSGLVRRCSKQIYLGFSELGEQGYEQRGELLGAIQRMLLKTSDME